MKKFLFIMFLFSAPVFAQAEQDLRPQSSSPVTRGAETPRREINAPEQVQQPRQRNRYQPQSTRNTCPYCQPYEGPRDTSGQPVK